MHVCVYVQKTKSFLIYFWAPHLSQEDTRGVPTMAQWVKDPACLCGCQLGPQPGAVS